jgi:hypothetical protein
LASSPTLGVVHLTEAWPEHKIRLDWFRGETRNADLAAVALGKPGVVAVTVEAKADGSFGRTIAEALAAAPAESNVPKRITTLASAVLVCTPAEIGSFRYQLLHGTAAGLILACEQAASAAVFAVLEFLGPSCSPRNLRRNASDLNAFIQALFPGASPLVPGQLVGPFSVPGGGLVPSGIPLFIGKASRQVS